MRATAKGLSTEYARRLKGRGMTEVIFLVEEDADGGWVATAVGHAIFTQADSIDELHRMVRDAVRCHFEEGKRPKLIRLHFVRDEVIAAE
jgi:predicted RNase H-like HicB family nuclease